MNYLSKRHYSTHGLYFENYKKAQYGYFGNLEVIDWKFGSWGEDVFVQRLS